MLFLVVSYINNIGASSESEGFKAVGAFAMVFAMSNIAIALLLTYRFLFILDTDISSFMWCARYIMVILSRALGWEEANENEQQSKYKDQFVL